MINVHGHRQNFKLGRENKNWEEKRKRKTTMGQDDFYRFV